MRKHDIEYVRDYFESEGYTLISEEYESNSTPLETICPNGHLYPTTFTNFKNAECRCPKCKRTFMTEEEAKQWFLERGCEMIGEFKGIGKNVMYKCSCGEPCTKKMKNLLLNEITECKKCKAKKRMNERKKSVNELLDKINF